jgi:hypothetical protein
MTDPVSERIGRSELEVLTRSGIPLILGGQTFMVRPRSIKSNRMWKVRVQGALSEKFTSLDGISDVDGFYGFLAESGDVLIDLVIAYDETNALPDRAWIEDNASDHEILEALMVLLEQAFPFFEIGRRVLPGEIRTIILGRLIGAALTSLSLRSTNAPSPIGGSKTPRRSKTA